MDRVADEVIESGFKQLADTLGRRLTGIDQTDGGSRRPELFRLIDNLPGGRRQYVSQQHEARGRLSDHRTEIRARNTPHAAVWQSQLKPRCFGSPVLAGTFHVYQHKINAWHWGDLLG